MDFFGKPMNLRTIRLIEALTVKTAWQDKCLVVFGDYFRELKIRPDSQPAMAAALFGIHVAVGALSGLGLGIAGAIVAYVTRRRTPAPVG